MADEAGVDSLLTPDRLVILEKIAKEEGFVDPLITSGEGAKKGDGFIGVVSRVFIEEQQKGSQKPTLPLIVKCLPANPADHLFSIDIFFRMETIFYRDIQSQFIRFQKERGITRYAANAPRCFDATNDIIMEDMRPRGYVMKEGNSIMDLAHCTAFLKELGRLHAVSLAMKDQEPEVYKRITKDLEEPFVVKEPQKLMKDRFDQAVKIAKEEFKKRVTLPDKERYVEIMERFLDDGYYKKMTDMLESWRSEPFAVINHGDCWSNNALYKYDTDDKSVPSSTCLIDFQIVRNVSPAMDLCTLIFLCTTKALRDEHYKDLLTSYHDSLSELMTKLGSDPEKIFPFSALEDQLKTFGKYNIPNAIHEMPIMSYDAADEPPVVGDVDPSLEAAFGLNHANMDACWSRICDVIVDMVDLGYVD